MHNTTYNARQQRCSWPGNHPLNIDYHDYDGKKVDELMADAGIVRHRGKIESTVNRARMLERRAYD